MTILFTPVGTTDPVRGCRDGAVLHILRHYPVDKVILFLTAEMEEHEREEHWYSKGIHSVKASCPIEWIPSHVENPQRFDTLTSLQEAFDHWYRKEGENTEWLLNISSGTPQMKTVMALLAIDYERTHAIQVNSPGGKSNVGNDPSQGKDMLEMIELNDDSAPDAPNRCVEPKLRLLRKYGIRLQITSLVEHYEYSGALDILSQNRSLFSEDTEKLLRHAAARENLRWRDANKEISNYGGSPLFPSTSDFAEYFRCMMLKQRKGQLADCIIKLSPVLLELGKKYMTKLASGFQIEKCGYRRRWDSVLVISRRDTEAYRPDVLTYLDQCFQPMGFKDSPLSMDIIAYLCEYLKVHDKKMDPVHSRLTDLFIRLRQIEQLGRNPIAHTITNLTEDKLKQLKTRDGQAVGMDSKTLISKLQDAVQMITGQRIVLGYDRLNEYIVNSMRES